MQSNRIGLQERRKRAGQKGEGLAEARAAELACPGEHPCPKFPRHGEARFMRFIATTPRSMQPSNTTRVDGERISPRAQDADGGVQGLRFFRASFSASTSAINASFSSSVISSSRFLMTSSSYSLSCLT